MATDFTNPNQAQAFKQRALQQGYPEDTVNAYISSRRNEQYVQSQNSTSPLADKLSQGNILSKILGGVIGGAEKAVRFGTGAIKGAGLISASALGNKEAKQLLDMGIVPGLTKTQVRRLQSTNIKDPLKEGGSIGASVAPYVIPGAKGGQAFLTGALRGASGDIGKQLEGDDPIDAGSVITSASIGSLAEGVLSNILGKRNNAGQSGKISKKMREVVLDPKVKSDPFYTKNIDDLLQAQNKLGLKGSARAQLEQMPEKFAELDGVIKSEISNTPSLNLRTVYDDFSKALDKVDYLGDEATFTKEVTKLNKRISDATQSGNRGIYDLKSELGGEMNLIFNKIAKGNDLTPKQAAKYAAFNSLKQSLDRVSPVIREANNLQKAMYEMAPGLVNSSKKGLSVPVLGKLEGTLKPAQATIDLAGRTLGPTTSSIENTTLKEILSRGAGMTAPQILSGNKNPPENNIVPSTPVNTGMETQGGNRILTNNEIAILSLIDPKNAETYQAIAKMGSSGSSAPNQAISQLKNLYSSVQSQGLTASQPGILGRILGGAKGTYGAVSQRSTEAATYKSIKTAFLSSIARDFGEKGTLTDQDIKRVDNALPSFSDTPEVAQRKFQELESVLSELKGKYPNNPAL